MEQFGEEKSIHIGKLVWGCCNGWWPALIVDAEEVGMDSKPGKVWLYWIGESRISQLREKKHVEPFSCDLKARLINQLQEKTATKTKTMAFIATLKLLSKKLHCVLTKPYYIWARTNLLRRDDLDDLKFHPYPSRIQRRLDELKELNTVETTDDDILEEKDPSKLSNKNFEGKNEKETLEPGHLSLLQQKPGTIAWAKILGYNWWPAMIVDYRDCGFQEPSFGCQWIIWYGDSMLSQVNHKYFLEFETGMLKMREYTLQTKRINYVTSVLDAAKDYCERRGVETDGWTVQDVFKWFAKSRNTNLEITPVVPGVEDEYLKYSTRVINKLRELKGIRKVAVAREQDIEDSSALQSVINGTNKLESLCLVCLKIYKEDMFEHPFFVGSMCAECLELYKPCIFSYGDDGKCFYCTLCAGADTIAMCDSYDCSRVYCTACLKYIICPQKYIYVLQKDPWRCFFCEEQPGLLEKGLVQPRADWKHRIKKMFQPNNSSDYEKVPEYDEVKRKIRVLSLFDGLSTGFLVLKKLGLEIEVYYASEIDPNAEMVSAAHFGEQIIRLGDVKGISEEVINRIAPIDLLIGGSPCNDLSLANPYRLGLEDPNGSGILFFEYCRIKDLLIKANNDRHLFWMFENVASMPSKFRIGINKHLGREPDLIDAADFSPQHRPRLYWSNLPMGAHSISSQDLQDVLTPNCNRLALVKKIQTVTTKVNSLRQGKALLKPVLMNGDRDSLWITELEQVFGFPQHYTDVKNLCATNRQKLIGKSWSVQTITAILRPLRYFFIINNEIES
ncbi:DNA (cytosine-5)-methyltransferase 3A [Orussus abietinus]|uniref:DNA (cytosine-5)-methyltransferase 3A n=1 Tax=Orussus abietinus TaxID=222816 RepID=UPI0006250A34|nr:DNA (cytosine-5)-methyltransferase 3A [Orussus abietinus]